MAELDAGPPDDAPFFVSDIDEDAPDVRLIIVGITGPPERWKPIAKRVGRVCRYMLFPFPEDPSADQTLFGNMVEYADVADTLQGRVIEGQPTLVFCVPGIDSNRRIGILTELLPRTLDHHQCHGCFLHFTPDRTQHDLDEGLLRAEAAGHTTMNLGPGPSSPEAESLEQRLAEWMTALDPQAVSSDES